jgi:hypothetical protein
MRPDLPETGQLILGAEFSRAVHAGQGVGGAVQKAVLWVLWAYEGRPISYAAIEARTGCAQASAFRAVQVLVCSGIITETDGGGCRSRTYRINYDRLRKLQTNTPLFATGGGCGGPVKERPVFDGKVLPVQGRTWSPRRAV